MIGAEKTVILGQLMVEMLYARAKQGPAQSTRDTLTSVGPHWLQSLCCNHVICTN